MLATSDPSCIVPEARGRARADAWVVGLAPQRTLHQPCRWRLGPRQHHAYSLLAIRDLLRRLTTDRRLLPEIVSGQTARRVTLT